MSEVSTSHPNLEPNKELLAAESYFQEHYGELEPIIEMSLQMQMSVNQGAEMNGNETVQEWQDRQNDRNAALSSETYIGSGADKDVFRVRLGEQDFALKLIKDGVEDNNLADLYEPLITAQGQPHFEQLVGLSPDKRIMITTIIPGKKISEVGDSQLMSINKDTLKELSDSLGIMAEMGLHPHNAGGIIYDKKTGFNFVDYTLDASETDGSRSDISKNLGNFIRYAFSDIKKFDELLEQKCEGMKVPTEAFRTTGLRKLAMLSALRKVKRIDH